MPQVPIRFPRPVVHGPAPVPQQGPPQQLGIPVQLRNERQAMQTPAQQQLAQQAQQQAQRAPGVAKLQAQNDLLRTRMDTILQHLQREREERRRDMEAVYATLAASRGASKAKGTWWRVLENMAIVAGTVVATYLAQRYLVGAMTERSPAQDSALAAAAAASAAGTPS